MRGNWGMTNSYDYYHRLSNSCGIPFGNRMSIVTRPILMDRSKGYVIIDLILMYCFIDKAKRLGVKDTSNTR